MPWDTDTVIDDTTPYTILRDKEEAANPHAARRPDDQESLWTMAQAVALVELAMQRGKIWRTLHMRLLHPLASQSELARMLDIDPSRVCRHLAAAQEFLRDKINHPKGDM